MQAFVNITVVTYNRVECTKQCLASIIERTHQPFVLTLIDNHSTDGTRAYLESLRTDPRYAPHINRIVYLERNMGISPAYNLGWTLSDAPYYMKIDNDVVFLRDDWLDILIKYATEIEDSAMIGFGENTSGLRHPADDRLSLHGHVGGCTLIRKEAHERLGFWNEDYGFYGEEDADFGLRARLAGMVNFTYQDDKGPFIEYVDGLDENILEYKAWKGKEREDNLREMFSFNDVLFKCGFRDVHVGRMYLPQPTGDTFTFVPDRHYLTQVEALKKHYLPLIPQIVETDEFKEIQKTYNIFY